MIFLLQEVPNLTQAQLYERISTFPTSSTTNDPHRAQDITGIAHQDGHFTGETRERSKNIALRLLNLAEKCRVCASDVNQTVTFTDLRLSQAQKMSGRSLRRLPVLAHARYIGTLSMPIPRMTNGINGVKHKPKSGYPSDARGSPTRAEVWLDAMERVVDGQAVEKGRLEE